MPSRPQTTNLHRATVLAMLKLCDLVVVVVAFVLSLVASQNQDVVSILEARVKAVNFLFLTLYVAYAHVVFHSFGLYRSYRLSPSSRELRDLSSAILVIAFPLLLFRGPLRFEYATAEFFVTFVVGAAFLLGAERRLLRIVARSMRKHGRNLRNAVLVGHGDGALEMASRLARRADLGYHVVELIETDEVGRTLGPTGTPMPAVERIAAIVAEKPIDEVFVGLPLDSGQSLIRSIVALCEEQGVTVRLASTVVDPVLGRAQVDEVDGRPIITIFTGPPDSLPIAIKRAIDLVLSAVAVVALAPLFLLIALLIKLDSRGPVLFRQERVGFNRRHFHALKFRTMVDGAERQQGALEALNEAEGPVFKIRNDPRVTRVGRWLRRLSLDELPQLFNVLRGDMSLVGPRPLPLRDVDRIDVKAHKRRFSVRPGITCLWQVNGREPRFEEWIKADMDYIDNWSLGLDLRIILKTIPAVLSGRGAY
jgi:exopolysaccharide biosynthesis polyprenyl glycosylphosphotransferase